MNLIKAFTWIVSNWSSILGALVTIIGCASLFIKGLEGLTKLLVTLFPSLKNEDDELLKIAAWLDALAKSSWLNTMAASPTAKASK